MVSLSLIFGYLPPSLAHWRIIYLPPKWHSIFWPGMISKSVVILKNTWKSGAIFTIWSITLFLISYFHWQTEAYKMEKMSPEQWVLLVVVLQRCKYQNVTHYFPKRGQDFCGQVAVASPQLKWMGKNQCRIWKQIKSDFSLEGISNHIFTSQRDWPEGSSQTFSGI